MKRRELVTLLGGAMATTPMVVARVVRAQNPGERVRRIGFLATGSEDDPVMKGYFAALVRGLLPLGWSEGRNLRIETRMAGGNVDRINAAGAELVRLSPDVIVAHGTSATEILGRLTRTVPIVFAAVTDPIGSGLAVSLARPGGNVTGFTNFEFSIAGKWLELLKEVAPTVRNVTILFNPDNAAMPGQLQAIGQAANALGLQLVQGQVRERSDIERTINGLAQMPNAGLLVLPEFVTVANRDLIIDLATRHRLPAAYAHRFFTEGGGLIAYGASIDDQYRGVASYVDRILRGEKPADLPIQQPTKFELVVNLKAAKAIGLTIPETFLVRADEVIE